MNTKVTKKTSTDDWHPADIKAALAKAGFTLSRVALEGGLRDSTSLSACLLRPMPANERRIAAALGIHPREIWPSRYDENGTPKLRGMHAIRCTAEMRAEAATGRITKRANRQLAVA